MVSYLSPEDVAAASSINIQSHRVNAMDETVAQLFWRKKFAIKTDKGVTPLFSAIEFGHLDVVNKLLAHPDINITDTMTDGTTPLSFAAQGGYLDIVNVLLGQHKVDINAARTNGATPLSIAAAHGHVNVKALKIKMLENYISKKSSPSVPEYKRFMYFFKRGASKTDKLAAALAPSLHL
jgi:ankyrin repeat protein